MRPPALSLTDLPARFWSHVHPLDGGCWLWTAGKTPLGYGRFWWNEHHTRFAHRLAYEALIGPIPHDLHIDHLCRNPPCVNPAHMEPVTPRTNILRGVGFSARYYRRTHCIGGHLLTDLVQNKLPHRVCRICHNEAQRRIRSERREPLCLEGLELFQPLPSASHPTSPTRSSSYTSTPTQAVSATASYPPSRPSCSPTTSQPSK